MPAPTAAMLVSLANMPDAPANTLATPDNMLATSAI